MTNGKVLKEMPTAMPVKSPPHTPQTGTTGPAGKMAISKKAANIKSKGAFKIAVVG